jgi:hypothetical protein
MGMAHVVWSSCTDHMLPWRLSQRGLSLRRNYTPPKSRSFTGPSPRYETNAYGFEKRVVREMNALPRA